MTGITQIISTLPTPPNPATDDANTFATKASTFTVAIAAMVGELNSLATQANALAFGSVFGDRYAYLSATTATDPGTGKLKFDNASLSLATKLYLSETDADNLNKAAFIATWDDNLQALKGLLRVIKAADQTVYADLAISGALTDNGTWVTANVSYVGGNGTLANNDPVVLQFQRYGADGASATFSSPLRQASTSGTITSADNGYEFEATAAGLTMTLDTPAGLGAGFTMLLLDSPNDYTLTGTFNDGTTSKKILARTVGLLQSDGSTHRVTSFTLGSYRNKIRNPRMDFAQRGSSPGTYGSGASAAYTLDGWQASWNTGGAIVAISQQADVMTGSECLNSLRATVNTSHAAPSSGQYFVIAQPIEGFLVRDLQGNPIALRFEVRSPKSGQHYVTLRNGGSDRSYVLPFTMNTANTWEVKTLAIPGGLITAGTWNWTTGLGVSLIFPLMAGSTLQTASTNQWVTGNFVTGTGQQNLLDTNGNIFAITGIQLEKGNASTPLEHRHIHEEWLFNQRYYELGYYIWSGYGGTPPLIKYTFVRTVPKRVTPTITFSNPAHSGFASVTSGSQTTNDFRIDGTTNTTGDMYMQGNWTATAEL